QGARRQGEDRRLRLRRAGAERRRSRHDESARGAPHPQSHWGLGPFRADRMTSASMSDSALSPPPPPAWPSVRGEFPAAGTAVYLDNAAVGLVPRRTQDAMARYYAGVPYNTGVRLSSSVFYGTIGPDAEAVTDAVGQARAAMARVAGVDSTDV